MRNFEHEALSLEGFERRALSMYGHTTSNNNGLAGTADRITRNFNELGKEFMEMAEKDHYSGIRFSIVITTSTIKLRAYVNGKLKIDRCKEVDLSKEFEVYSITKIDSYGECYLGGDIKSLVWDVTLSNGSTMRVTGVTESNVDSLRNREIYKMMAENSSFDLDGIRFTRDEEAKEIAESWIKINESFDGPTEHKVRNALEEMIA